MIMYCKSMFPNSRFKQSLQTQADNNRFISKCDLFIKVIRLSAQQSTWKWIWFAGEVSLFEWVYLVLSTELIA